MTGAQASVVRAGIMGALLVLARKVGRQSSATVGIIVTATVMIVLNPYILRYDIGFQLSFLAFVGIIYIAPMIKTAIGRIIPESSPKLSHDSWRSAYGYTICSTTSVVFR